MSKLGFLFFLIILWHPVSGQDNAPAPCPCCAPEYRQFDFWVGDWTAFTGQQEQEKKAGDNRIVLLQDSCVIQESWTSANGNYTGTSYNWYDPQDGQWHQSWIDNQGASLRLAGNLEDGKMVMRSGMMKNQQGNSYINRITWTPNADGTVRQHWEISYNQGTSWQPVFDGIYRRKTKE